MNNNPLISILVNCRNGLPYLGECLDSIYNQTYQNFEIIFVDNFSTDGSKQFVSKYDSRLKIYSPLKPMTLYEARNFGLQYFNGDYLAILDSDDFWHPRRLEWQLLAIRDNPNAFFVYGNSYVKFEDRLSIYSIIFNFLKYVASLKKSTKFLSLDYLIKNYNINLQTVLISKNIIEDERFCSKLNYAGDMEFFLRILLKSQMSPLFVNRFISTTRIHHRQLSKLQGIRWVAELKYISLFRLRSFFTKKQKEYFVEEIEVVRFQYLKSQERIEEAHKILKKIWNRNLSFRIHFIISSLKMLRLKCKEF